MRTALGFALAAVLGWGLGPPLQQAGAAVIQDSQPQAAAEEQEPAMEKSSCEDVRSARAAQRKQWGSLGFYKNTGDSKAVKVLRECRYRGYIKTYDNSAKGCDREVDATSLKNMKHSFRWIRRCNKIRKQRGLRELKITDLNMAQAQANADYSDQNIHHAEQFRNSAENAAWVWSEREDPFDYWYSVEKKQFEKYCRDRRYPGLRHMTAYQVYKKYPRIFKQVGHYLNIIDPSLKTTGFARCDRGSKYNYTYIQVFDSRAPGRAWSAAQYERKFNLYCAGELFPQRPQLKAVRSGRGTIRAVWNTAVGAQGYQIRFSRKKSMHHARCRRAGAAAYQKTVSGVKRHKKYYLQVRAWRNIDGSRYYSAWSQKKLCRVK
ncbi:MAG: CAP domain-containing protein [Anaerovoracaceae bacterium]